MTLLEEITQDPAGLGYAQWLPDNPGMASWLLNEPRYPAPGRIARADFAVWCGTSGLRAVIEDTATAAGHPLRSAALLLVDFLRGGVAETIDLALPSNQAMLAAWVGAGAITEVQRDELVGISNRLVSRAEQLGLGLVTVADVQGAWAAAQKAAPDAQGVM